MKPPECVICGADAASGGGAVRFVPRPADTEWRDRAAREGIMGHPPDTGWFCAAHHARASELAATATIDQVLHSMREAPGSRVSDTVVVDIGAVERALRDLFATLAREVGLEDSSVDVTSDRVWTPMDGAEPPHCPYVDTSQRVIRADGMELALTHEHAWWSDIQPARGSVTLLAKGFGDKRDFRISVHVTGQNHPVECFASGAVPTEVSRVLSDLGVTAPQ